MNISIDEARRVLQAQPFSRLLEARLTEFSDTATELRIPIREHVKQQNGFVHGGVVSYAADNALTFAGGVVLGPLVVTSEYKINYLRPAIGDWLIARARAVYAGQRQAACRAEVFTRSGDEETLCALAQGTISRVGQPPGAAGSPGGSRS
ncbi:MAG: PaaI family thioesterase [Ottowia sp.]|nr:PaaI family thioesterase [Ottowia sp.]